jgi:hypothetical protein
VVTTEFVSTRMPLPLTEIEPASDTCPAMVLAPVTRIRPDHQVLRMTPVPL